MTPSSTKPFDHRVDRRADGLEAAARRAASPLVLDPEDLGELPQFLGIVAPDEADPHGFVKQGHESLRVIFIALTDMAQQAHTGLVAVQPESVNRRDDTALHPFTG